MSAPINVLAVLDDHMRVHGRNGCPQHQRELLVVRNALADLILALELSDAWIREASHQGMPRATATLERNHTALSRVKGGAE